MARRPHFYDAAGPASMGEVVFRFPSFSRVAAPGALLSLVRRYCAKYVRHSRVAAALRGQAPNRGLFA